MIRPKLSLRFGTSVPLRTALADARRLGVKGVQLDAAQDLSPRNLSQSARRQIVQWLRTHDLQAAALTCILRHGLDTPERLDERIDYVKGVLSLAFELGCCLAVLPVGSIPEAADTSARRWLTEALGTLARHGDRVGSALALHSGVNSGTMLAAFLRSFDTGGLAVAYDPTALLIGGFDPASEARALQPWIRYVIARDAQRTAVGRIQEVSLGHGDIDWLGQLAWLGETEYTGWITINEPPEQVAAAVAFFARLGP
jgi:sugar phosphate isomerase/epimerase